jgi:hypothetical protein
MSEVAQTLAMRPECLATDTWVNRQQADAVVRAFDVKGDAEEPSLFRSGC